MHDMQPSDFKNTHTYNYTPWAIKNVPLLFL